MKHRQLTWRERGCLWLRLGIRLILAAGALWLLMRFGRPVLSLFAPFLFALAAAVLLNPPVRWFQKKLGWSRQTLTMLLMLLLLGLLSGGVTFLVYAAGQELLDLVQNWDGLLVSFQSSLDTADALFSRLLALIPPEIAQSVQTAESELLSWLSQSVPAALTDLATRAGHKAMGLPSFFVAVIIFVMATYFLTADYPYLRTRAAQYMDEDLRHFLGQMRTTALGAFGGYLKAEFLLSVGVFFILLGGFLLTRQPYALLLALGLAVLDFIPIVGAGTIMVPWAVIALFSQNYPTAIRIMVVWGIIVLFRRVMEPKFVGDQTGLSPILSLLSIYVGMKLGGVAGMILGPVLTLMALNLAGMGIFGGLRADLAAAVEDISCILAERPRS